MIPKDRAGIEELNQFQSYLSEFDITVFTYGSKDRDVIFKGQNANAKHRIYLIHKDSHYNVITSLTSAFCSIYFCDMCFKPFNDKRFHICMKACPCCKQKPACDREGTEILCVDCKLKFRSSECLRKHKLKTETGFSICEERKRCEKCSKPVYTYRTHTCGEKFCNVC